MKIKVYLKHLAVHSTLSRKDKNDNMAHPEILTGSAHCARNTDNSSPVAKKGRTNKQ